MKRLRPLVPFLFSLAALVATACAGRTFMVAPGELQKVQSIAIVGFDTYVSSDIGGKLAKLIGPDLLIQTLASGWSADKLNPVDSKMPYDALARRLEAELGVRVLTHEELTGNAAYAEAYRRLANEHAVGNMRIEGVLSGDAARNLPVAERVSLRKALGVDAVMAVEMSYWIDDTDTTSDIGGEKLWARIDAALFADTEAPIWRDQADGELSKKGIPPLVRQEAIADMRVALGEATDNALRLFFDHLNRRCPDCRLHASATSTPATAPTANTNEASVTSQAAPTPAATEVNAANASGTTGTTPAVASPEGAAATEGGTAESSTPAAPSKAEDAATAETNGAPVVPSDAATP